MKKICLIFIILVTGFLITSCSKDKDSAPDLWGYGIVGPQSSDNYGTVNMFGNIILVTPSLIGLDVKKTDGQVSQLTQGDLVFGEYRITERMESGPVKYKTKLHKISIPTTDKVRLQGLDTLGNSKVSMIKKIDILQNYMFLHCVYNYSPGSKHTFTFATDSVWNEGEYNYFRNDSLFLEFRYKVKDLFFTNNYAEKFSITDFNNLRLPTQDSVTLVISYINTAGNKVQYKPSKPIKFMPFER